ncbi:MAG: rhodanese-like domain-containing protein [Planctomycetota bacterium]
MSTASAFASPSVASPTVAPAEAARLVEHGEAFIVDVREPDEHRREHVAGAALFPSSFFSVSGFPSPDRSRQTLVMCRSGSRARKVAEALWAAGRTDVRVIEGGIVGWCKAGLPAERNASAPLPLMRQVMITVGAMLLGLTALAVFVSPWFLAAIGAVAAGLLFAGLTGICALATMLSKMPWNRAPLASAPKACAPSGGACCN